MASRLLEEYAGRRSHSPRVALPHLTDREFEVLQLVGEVKSTREMAEQLHLSQKTVETHRVNLMRKLKLKNATELLRFALQYVEREASGSWKG
jgi:DNA-binding NarL/FixJ family response regulator